MGGRQALLEVSASRMKGITAPTASPTSFAKRIRTAPRTYPQPRRESRVAILHLGTPHGLNGHSAICLLDPMVSVRLGHTPSTMYSASTAERRTATTSRVSAGRG